MLKSNSGCEGWGLSNDLSEQPGLLLMDSTVLSRAGVCTLGTETSPRAHRGSDPRCGAESSRWDDSGWVSSHLQDPFHHVSSEEADL